MSARNERSPTRWSSKMVDLMSRIVVSRSRTALSRRSRTSSLTRSGGALQLQPGREQPLDDEVVQVPRDAVPVGHQRQLLAVRDRLGPVQGEGRLVRERGQQVHLLDLEARPPDLERHQQHAALGDLRAQRHQHDGAVLRVRYDGHSCCCSASAISAPPGPRRCRDPGDVRTVGRHDLGLDVTPEQQSHGRRPDHPPGAHGDLAKRLDHLDGGLQGLGDLHGGLEPQRAAARSGRKRERSR